MNNTITEDYCSWDVSYLLKQKGLWIPSLIQYYENQQYLQGITHSLAIKWVRENFGYHITICLSLQGYYYYSIQMTDGEYLDIIQETYKKPEDSVEGALLYTLKNLI